MIGDCRVNLANLRFVAARAVPTFDEQVRDGDAVAVVLVGASDADAHTVDLDVIDHEIAWASVARAVSTGPPKFAERGNVRVLDNRSRATLRVVLKNLV